MVQPSGKPVAGKGGGVSSFGVFGEGDVFSMWPASVKVKAVSFRRGFPLERPVIAMYSTIQVPISIKK